MKNTWFKVGVSSFFASTAWFAIYLLFKFQIPVPEFSLENLSEIQIDLMEEITGDRSVTACESVESESELVYKIQVADRIVYSETLPEWALDSYRLGVREKRNIMLLSEIEAPAWMFWIQTTELKKYRAIIIGLCLGMVLGFFIAAFCKIFPTIRGGEATRTIGTLIPPFIIASMLPFMVGGLFAWLWYFPLVVLSELFATTFLNFLYQEDDPGTILVST